MKTILNNRVNLTDLPGHLGKSLIDRLTITNPAFLEAKKRGRWTGKTPVQLRFYERTQGGGLSVPRGAWPMVKRLAAAAGEPATLVYDRRLRLPPYDLTFLGALRPYQQAAVDAMLGHDDGVICADTGSGKTVIGLAMIAQRRQPALILCHTTELMRQWADRIREFLGVEPGMIGAGKINLAAVTVGMVQTCAKRVPDLAGRFGHIIVDECHRAPSKTFSSIVDAMPGKYRLGLSATPERRDGLGLLIGLACGEFTHTVNRQWLQNVGAVLKPSVLSRRTEFVYHYSDDYPKMLAALVADPVRNAQIAADVWAMRLQEAGAVLVVSDRVAHLETLQTMLGTDGTAILTGKVKKADRERIVFDLAAGRVKILFSTLALIGEGFDAAGLSVVCLATPIRYHGRLVQVCGRVLRPSPGKTATILDYCDARNPVLLSQYGARAALYHKRGWEIEHC